MKWMENLTGGYSSSAKVVNGKPNGSKPTVSFGDEPKNPILETKIYLPDAKSPIVWRMELGEIKAAAFEIQQEDGTYILVMKTPKGSVQEIAPFNDKGGAMRALMAASHAMEQAQSVTTAANDGAPASTIVSAAPAKKGGGQMVAGIVGIILLGGLIFAMMQVGPHRPQDFNANGSMTKAGASSTTGTGDAANAPGVPVSADDFLRKR